MAEFYSLNRSLYLFFVIVCMLFTFVNFYLLNLQNPRKKYLAILPLYYTFLTCLGFMSIMMVGLKGWIFGTIVGSLWVLILVLTIKTYKLAKYHKEFDIIKVKKKSILDLALYFIFLLMGL